MINLKLLTINLWKKINYMVHMLEGLEGEKTDNIMEEFILYTFLGVFIIFVLDSFSRTANIYPLKLNIIIFHIY